MTSQIHTAISNGINIKRFLILLQMDELSFRDRLEYEKFTKSEVSKIEKEIERWEAGYD